MHESVAKSILAGYKRKLRDQIERYNAAHASAPLPGSRRAWFKAALRRAVNAPGTCPIACFDIEGSVPMNKLKGKTLRTDLLMLEPVTNVTIQARPEKNISWVVAGVRIDAKNFVLSKKMTKLYVSTHAIERVLQRLNFTRIEAALECVAQAIRQMPSGIMERRDLDLLTPVRVKGDLVGAFAVTSDRDGSGGVIITTFVSTSMMSPEQVRFIENTDAVMHAHTGALMEPEPEASIRVTRG